MSSAVSQRASKFENGSRDVWNFGIFDLARTSIRRLVMRERKVHVNVVELKNLEKIPVYLN